MASRRPIAAGATPPTSTPAQSQSYSVACVRAGSNFTVATNDPQRKALADPDAPNWTIIVLYDLNDWRAARLHARVVSLGLARGRDQRAGGLRGRRARMPRCSASSAPGSRRLPGCRAICAVRPIKRVQVFSPNPAHRQAFVKRMAGENVEVVAVDDPREVVRGAHVVCCATNSKTPVLRGDWLEPGQMVITIANSDVLNTRREVDETTFARASAIIINDWESVTANRQVELLEPIEKGLVKRETCTRSAISSPARPSCAAIRARSSTTRTTPGSRCSLRRAVPSFTASSRPKEPRAPFRLNGSQVHAAETQAAET